MIWFSVMSMDVNPLFILGWGLELSRDFECHTSASIKDKNYTMDA